MLLDLNYEVNFIVFMSKKVDTISFLSIIYH